MDLNIWNWTFSKTFPGNVSILFLFWIHLMLVIVISLRILFSIHTLYVFNWVIIESIKSKVTLFVKTTIVLYTTKREKMLPTSSVTQTASLLCDYLSFGFCFAKKKKICGQFFNNECLFHWWQFYIRCSLCLSAYTTFFPLRLKPIMHIP